MKAFDVGPDGAIPTDGGPLVLAQELVVPGDATRWHKGRLLSPADITALRAAVSVPFRVIALGPKDLHEDEASRRIARAVASPEVRVHGPAVSAMRLVAASRGLLTVDAPLLKRINALPSVSVYTLLDGQPVEQDQPIAGVKVTPLVVPGATVAAVEALCQENGAPIGVRAFRPLKVAVIVRERLNEARLERFREQMRERTDWFGGELDEIVLAPDATADEVTALIRERLLARAEFIVVAGTRSTDPLDEGFAGARGAGARVIRQGMPSHPGSTYWLLEIGNVYILGLASCGTLSDSTTFDLLLPRFFAALPVDADYLAGLGHGGMLGPDMQFRFPSYLRRRTRGSTDGDD